MSWYAVQYICRYRLVTYVRSLTLTLEHWVPQTTPPRIRADYVDGRTLVASFVFFSCLRGFLSSHSWALIPTFFPTSASCEKRDPCEQTESASTERSTMQSPAAFAFSLPAHPVSQASRTACLHGAASVWICGQNATSGAVLPTGRRPVRSGSLRMAGDGPAASVADIEKDASARMQKTLESTSASFNTVRTGRANASILDRVTVDYYGAETPLNQLATVSVSGPSTIVVDPYDKSVIADVERGLMESDIGITPSNDGSVIRLAVPPLTQERRKELTKQVKAMAEDGRVALRNIRRDAVDKCKKLEKAKDIGQDESKTMQAALQKATDKFVRELDSVLKSKEDDLMKV